MDLQTRKLRVIEQVINLNDEIVMNQIEEFIKNTLGNSESEDISSSVSVDQLIERASLPLHDYKMGRIKTQEEVEQLSKDW
ncbi:MAG: hypothetical protein GW809_00280 [Bacteroidetes bacterium]|nr:hypothetical protein [Bacteroidota bacterium]NCQ10603.1 hypothetical protein [Bacteroidota bacterium]